MATGKEPVKILTVCAQGLVRSVGLADVLKLHFEPVDVIPVGYRGNSKATLRMLMSWADYTVVMESKYAKKLPVEPEDQILVCEVGPDVYGNSHNRQLIDKVWRWTRQEQNLLGITEHHRRI